MEIGHNVHLQTPQKLQPLTSTSQALSYPSLNYFLTQSQHRLEANLMRAVLKAQGAGKTAALEPPPPKQLVE